MAQRTRTQRYAGRAIERVLSVAGDAGLRREYRARALSFPAMVLQSGLAQAVGFLRAKSGDDAAYRCYLRHLAEVHGTANGNALHEAIIAAPLPAYRRLTQELLEAAALIKRYAQAEIKDEPEPGAAP